MRHGQKVNKRYATIQTSQTELSCILLEIRLLESKLIIISVNQMRGLKNEECEKSRGDFVECSGKIKPYLRLVSCKVNKNFLENFRYGSSFSFSPSPPAPHFLLIWKSVLWEGYSSKLLFLFSMFIESWMYT